MTNGATYRRNAAGVKLTIVVDTVKTIVDLSKMTNEEQAGTLWTLLAWKKNGFRGYPVWEP